MRYSEYSIIVIPSSIIQAADVASQTQQTVAHLQNHRGKCPCIVYDVVHINRPHLKANGYSLAWKVFENYDLLLLLSSFVLGLLMPSGNSRLWTSTVMWLTATVKMTAQSAKPLWLHPHKKPQLLVLLYKWLWSVWWVPSYAAPASAHVLRSSFKAHTAKINCGN